MYTDLPYRIALIAIAAVQLAISRIYLREAGADKSMLRRRAEGPLLATGAAVFICGYAIAVLIYLLNPTWMAWSAASLPGALRWLGAPMMALGAALHLWGSQHLGRNLTVTISTREAHTLITSGPYRWVRHPLYSGGMLESLGVCLLLADGAVAFFAACFWAVVVRRTHVEEQALIATFGASYLRYQDCVGRFLPKCVFRTNSG